jgi:hypothetical protein
VPDEGHITDNTPDQAGQEKGCDAQQQAIPGTQFFSDCKPVFTTHACSVMMGFRFASRTTASPRLLAVLRFFPFVILHGECNIDASIQAMLITFFASR